MCGSGDSDRYPITYVACFGPPAARSINRKDPQQNDKVEDCGESHIQALVHTDKGQNTHVLNAQGGKLTRAEDRRSGIHKE